MTAKSYTIYLMFDYDSLSRPSPCSSQVDVYRKECAENEIFHRYTPETLQKDDFFTELVYYSKAPVFLGDFAFYFPVRRFLKFFYGVLFQPI